MRSRVRVGPCQTSHLTSHQTSLMLARLTCLVLPLMSGLMSGLKENHVLNHSKNHVRSSSRARVVCPKCGHDFPGGYGSKCHKCNYDPSKGKPTADTQAKQPTQEPTICTCGDGYRNSYNRRCVDCKGTPSAAQRDAVQQPPQTAAPPPLSKTETQPPHISDEPAGPNQLRFEGRASQVD